MIQLVVFVFCFAFGLGWLCCSAYWKRRWNDDVVERARRAHLLGVLRQAQDDSGEEVILSSGGIKVMDGGRLMYCFEEVLPPWSEDGVLHVMSDNMRVDIPLTPFKGGNDVVKPLTEGATKTNLKTVTTDKSTVKAPPAPKPLARVDTHPALSGTPPCQEGSCLENESVL